MKIRFSSHLPPVNRLAEPNILSSYLVRLIPWAAGHPLNERCVKYVPFIWPVPSQPESKPIDFVLLLSLGSLELHQRISTYQLSDN